MDRLGYMTAAGTGYILRRDPDTVRAPDFAYTERGRLKNGLPDGYIPFGPDLAIEVVSPLDSAEEIEEKRLDYLRYGVRLAVFAFYKSRTVTVHTARGGQFLTESDMLDFSEVLPGLTLSVRDLFDIDL